MKILDSVFKWVEKSFQLFAATVDCLQIKANDGNHSLNIFAVLYEHRFHVFFCYWQKKWLENLITGTRHCYEWDQVGLSRASLVCSYWVRKKPGSSKHVRLFALIHLLWSTRDLKTKMAQGRNHGKNFKAQSHSICRLIAHSTGFEPTVSTVNIHTSIKGWPGGRWHGGVKRPLRGQSLKDSCTLSTSAWWWW